MSAIAEFFFGKDPQLKPFDLFSPGQQQFQQNILGQLGGPTSSGIQALMRLLGGDQASLDEYSAPYMRQFKTQILPSIFERFGGGESGASSGLMNAATEAGAGLQGQIASDRQRMQLGGLGALSGLAGIGLQPQKGFMNIPGQGGAMQSFAQALPMLLALL